MSDTLIPSGISATPTTPIDQLSSTGRNHPIEFGLVPVDLYRDIHKAIRVEMLSAITDLGSLDPADGQGLEAARSQIAALADLLTTHAEHEDVHIEPVLEERMPELAEIISGDHSRLEGRMAKLVDMSNELVEAPSNEQRLRAHHLYLELALFSSAYLQHQDIEECVIMPTLAAAIGIDELLGINGAIVASIPPDEMARSLAIMIPAMNVDDRTELLGGMQVGAPPEVFAGVWGLVGSMLPAADVAALGGRLGIDAST